MDRLAFNIETGVNVHRLHLMPEPEIKLGNLKDPAKIDEKIKERQANQLALAAVDANFARVVCISTAWRSKLTMAVVTNSYFRDRYAPDADEATVDAAERALLELFWQEIFDREGYATFNGAAFDVPFLMRRSLLLGVRPLRIDCHQYHVIEPNAQHLDVMKVLQDWESGNGTGYSKNLEFYADLILGQKPPAGAAPGKGEIGALFEAGDLEPIRKVCEWHATVALELAEAVSPVYC